MKIVKNQPSLLLLTFCIGGNIKAQPFNDALKQDYDFFNSSTAANKEAAVIKLEQIAASYPRQWAANYYAAYADAATSITLSVGANGMFIWIKRTVT